MTRWVRASPSHRWTGSDAAELARCSVALVIASHWIDLGTNQPLRSRLSRSSPMSGG